MRITYLTRAMEVGGAEVQLATLAAAVARRGHQVDVLTFYPGGNLTSTLGEAGVPYADLGKGGRWDLAGFFGRLVRRLRQSRPDVLHSFLGPPNIMAAATKPFLPRCKVVWGVRSSDMDLTKYDWSWRASLAIERRLSIVADRIVTNSTSGRRFLEAAGFDARRLSVVPNGIDTARFAPSPELRALARAEFGFNDSVAVIGHVARLDPIKDFETLFAAAVAVRQDVPHLRILVVGSGDATFTATLHARASALGLQDTVVWAGLRRDMNRLYNAMDIHCLASFSEGFPNAVAEGMAAGAIAVASDVGDVRTMVGDAGIIVPVADVAALTSAWRRVLGLSAADRRRLAQAGRQRIVDLYGVETMTDAMEAIYRANLRQEVRQA